MCPWAQVPVWVQMKVLFHKWHFGVVLSEVRSPLSCEMICKEDPWFPWPGLGMFPKFPALLPFMGPLLQLEWSGVFLALIYAVPTPHSSSYISNIYHLQAKLRAYPFQETFFHPDTSDGFSPRKWDNWSVKKRGWPGMVVCTYNLSYEVGGGRRFSRSAKK
jgi:hypothetical protein